MTEFDNDARQSLRNSILFAFAGGILSCATWYFLDRRDSSALHEEVQVEAAAIGAIVEREMRATKGAVQRLAHQWGARGGIPVEEWRMQALECIADLGAVQGMAQVAPDLTVNIAVPQRFSAMEGQNVRDIPSRAAAYGLAAASPRAVVSPYLQLLPQGRGLLVTAASRDGALVSGYTTALVVMEEWLDDVLGLFHDVPWSIRLRFDGKVVFESGGQPVVTQVRRLDLDSPGAWQLEVGVDQDGLDILRRDTPLQILVAGLLLTALFTYLFYHRTRTAAELFRLGFHDSLTNLPNRNLFRDRLQQALVRQQRFGEPFALLIMDLDGFKPFNDRLGHLAGDAVLREVATRMLHAVRESDTVARLGGDEFAAILHGVGSPAAAAAIAGKIHVAIGRPLEIQPGSETLPLAVSIGIAICPHDGQHSDELFRHADKAMYAEKRAHEAASA